jgi:replicative DNA helicase
MIPGDAVLIAARTGVGKTRFCTQLALAEAQKSNRVLFMTTEEAEFQTHWRLVEMLSKGKITVKELRTGKLQKDHDKGALYLTLSEQIKAMPIEIVRVNGWSVDRVVARIARHDTGYYRVVLVDYLQRLGQTPGWDRKRSDEELGHRMQVLKNVALDQQTVIVVPSQINRDGANRDQGPEHLAGSDIIGHEADIMLSIQRGENDGNIATFRIGKTRWGDGTGRKVTAYFDPHAGTYGNPATDTQESTVLRMNGNGNHAFAHRGAPS